MKRLINLTKKLTSNRINLTSFTIITDPTITADPESDNNWQLILKTYLFIDINNFQFKEYVTDIKSLDQTLKFIRKEYTLIKEFYNTTPKETLFPFVLLYDLIDRLEQNNIKTDNQNIYLSFKNNGVLSIIWDQKKEFIYNFKNFDQAVNETIDYLNKEQTK